MSNLENDLIKCLELIDADWNMQNNYQDKKTNFIYKCKTLDDCLYQINLNKVNEQYALHRWYNYMTSIVCENIFCEFGAIHEKDIYNHDVDIYIDGIPFDVKVTIYPAKLSNRPYDLKKREGKNSMIKWYYEHQSQQSRKQLLNRLYVVCDSSDPYECLKMKSNFSLLREKIGAFMKHSLTNGVNEITIIDNNQLFKLKSDIIYITQ